jgi:UDP-N-acetylglucosamine acyltransferase
LGPIDIGGLIRQIPTQYPFVLVDRVLEHDPARGLVAVKNVTGAEAFFEGHFPGAPVMPGVLLMESLAQAAGIWLLNNVKDPRRAEVHVVGIDEAKFRRPVLPGDQLRLDVQLVQRKRNLYRVRGEIRAGEQRVAEARILLSLVEVPAPQVDATARVAKGAELAPGVQVGPYCIVGPEVRLGARTRLEAHVVIAGDTELGADNRVFPFASIGFRPQDLKYRGEHTRLVIGDRNTIREYVTIHPGTLGGGGITQIGSDNLLMAHAHVAHDCRIGDHTVFGNTAALAGHVEVGDWATIAAFSGVHQFCRVGVHAYVGAYTVITQDVLPYSKTVGNRARIYGLNAVGLARRGFSPEAVRVIRHAYRVLLQSGLNLSQALEQLEAQQPSAGEVRTLVEFIRSSERGVIVKRRRRRPAPGA